MVNQDYSRFVMQRVHLQRANQYPVKDDMPHYSNYGTEGNKSQSPRPHSFIVDWQISESEKGGQSNIFIQT
jgi:hypothetical protein